MRARLTAALAVLVIAGAAATAIAAAQAPEAAFSRVEILPVPTSQTLLGVHFPDALHGYAVGGFGVVVATKDGGKTWVQQKSGVEAPFVPGEPTTALRSVSFSDSLRGWAVGDHMVSTSDGGATWVEQPLPPINDRQAPRPWSDPENHYLKWSFLDVQFMDARNGYLVGAGGTMFSTSDGGASWVWHGDSRYGNVWEVSFTDRQHGRVVGGAGPNAYATMWTADGGATWTSDPARDAGPQVPSTSFETMSFVDRERGYIASSAGRILVTADGGRNWSVQRKDTTETFYGLDFADARRGAAVGYLDIGERRKAAIVTTGDGGETWVPRPVDAAIVWDVTFAEPTIAYAVGCEVFAETCQKSLIVRITFPSAPPAASGGGFAVPLPFLVVGGVLVAALTWILVVRRRPMGERH